MPQIPITFTVLQGAIYVAVKSTCLIMFMASSGMHAEPIPGWRSIIICRMHCRWSKERTVYVVKYLTMKARIFAYTAEAHQCSPVQQATRWSSTQIGPILCPTWYPHLWILYERNLCVNTSFPSGLPCVASELEANEYWLVPSPQNHTGRHNLALCWV